LNAGIEDMTTMIETKGVVEDPGTLRDRDPKTDTIKEDIKTTLKKEKKENTKIHHNLKKVEGEKEGRWHLDLIKGGLGIDPDLLIEEEEDIDIEGNVIPLLDGNVREMGLASYVAPILIGKEIFLKDMVKVSFLI